MSRKIVVSTLVLTLTLGLLAGFLADVPASRVPQVLAAACKGPNGLCNGGLDPTKTATMNVEHSTVGGASVPVEPDSGESWTITAYWNTQYGTPCSERSETAGVDVDWNGSGWVVSNKSTTSNILDMKVCTAGLGCLSGGTLHDFEYQLAVDITELLSNVVDEGISGGDLLVIGGGGRDDPDTVLELDARQHGGDQVRRVDAAPPLLGSLDQLEGHRQGCLA
jgi:hypothetical protein